MGGEEEEEEKEELRRPGIRCGIKLKINKNRESRMYRNSPFSLWWAEQDLNL
jgi:hypothetical protein